MRKQNESEGGFWGTVARKAKAILDDDVPPEHSEASRAVHEQEYNIDTGGKFSHLRDGAQYQAPETNRRPGRAALRKGFGAIASSINKIGSALEEGLNIVENRTADIIQETRSQRSNVRQKAAPDLNKQPMKAGYARELSTTQNQINPVAQSDMDIQLQASRDVAMAMAAKTKLLLRELKTVKADLAFAKERCHQLEDENRILRESLEKGDNPEDDDLIRLQLESLLAEKARLAQENSLFARENRFLREVVEYHQLTMQDVVYLNERNEEITQVYPVKPPGMTDPFSAVPSAKVPGMTDPFSTATIPSLSSSFRSHELVRKFDSEGRELEL